MHLGADLDGLTGTPPTLAAGECRRDPFLLVGQMTTTDPTRSPAGTESLWAYTHLPRRPDWPPARSPRHVDRIEAVLRASTRPASGDLVVGRHVAGPRSWRRRTRAWSAARSAAAPRARTSSCSCGRWPGSAAPDTPIDRLYLASCVGAPGRRRARRAGANAARAALARARRLTGGLYAAAIAAAQHKLYSDGRRTAANEGERLDR